MRLFRDPGGKPSMTRVIALLLALDATALAGAIVWYVVHCTPKADVLMGAASVVGAFVASGCVALMSRLKGKDSDDAR